MLGRPVAEFHLQKQSELPHASARGCHLAVAQCEHILGVTMYPPIRPSGMWQQLKRTPTGMHLSSRTNGSQEQSPSSGLRTVHSCRAESSDTRICLPIDTCMQSSSGSLHGAALGACMMQLWELGTAASQRAEENQQRFAAAHVPYWRRRIRSALQSRQGCQTGTWERPGSCPRRLPACCRNIMHS